MPALGRVVYQNEDAVHNIYAAGLLANFFESGWAIQVLIGDMDRAQYFASRLTRAEIKRHLRIMVDMAVALPEEVSAQMPLVNWQAWRELDAALPCLSRAQKDVVWFTLETLVPVTGYHLRQYKAKLPELFSFSLA
ncbi:hypothetical protein GCM10028811_34980 [Uliginosibacterium sediminicola]